MSRLSVLLLSVLNFFNDCHFTSVILISDLVSFRFSHIKLNRTGVMAFNVPPMDLASTTTNFYKSYFMATFFSKEPILLNKELFGHHNIVH